MVILNKVSPVRVTEEKEAMSNLGEDVEEVESPGVSGRVNHGHSHAGGADHGHSHSGMSESRSSFIFFWKYAT